MYKLINYYIYVKYLFINTIYCVLAEKVLIKTIYLYNSYFLSSNLIGWEEWDKIL